MSRFPNPAHKQLKISRWRSKFLLGGVKSAPLCLRCGLNISSSSKKKNSQLHCISQSSCEFPVVPPVAENFPIAENFPVGHGFRMGSRDKNHHHCHLINFHLHFHDHLQRSGGNGSGIRSTATVALITYFLCICNAENLNPFWLQLLW